ncbi:MAG: thioredoxin family protein [Opitutaceae bacterium]
MKLLNALLISLLTFVLYANGSVDTGAKAPDFTLTDVEGKPHSLSDFKGKYVVLEWTNYGCPFVRKFYGEGHMQALQKEMTGKDVVWLQICSSTKGKQGHLSADEAKAVNAEKGVTSTAYLLDESGDVGRLYDARTTPHMYLISPEGLLVYQGAIDSIRSARSSDISKATNYVKAAYASAIAGESIEKATTRPYGCGVKY